MNEPDLEDTYELCPMQEGLLFHSQLEPGAGYYVEQFCCSLQGQVDPGLLEAAWQKIVDRHGVLRSCISWNTHKKPTLAIHQSVPVRIQQLDWSERASHEPEFPPHPIPLPSGGEGARRAGEGEAVRFMGGAHVGQAVGVSHEKDQDHPPNSEELESRLRAFLRGDRNRGFDFAQPPLMRFCLIRNGEKQFHFIWSFHHLLLDGWSYLIVLKEFFSLYDALVQGKNLDWPRCRPFRDFVAWCRHLDLTQAEVFWRRTLKGFTAPTSLSRVLAARNAGGDSAADSECSFPASGDGSEDDHGREQFGLGMAATMALRTLARQSRLTLNTLIQGAWALLLHGYTHDPEVIFGVTVAARPPGLAGVESMVGLFINTLPLRVQINPQDELIPWFRQLQNHQIELREFERTPLISIQQCAELPPGVPLFDSILVYENVPFDTALWERFESLQIRDVRFLSKTHYPITVSVYVGEEISVSLNCRRTQIGSDAMRRVREHLRALLQAIAENPRCRLGELPQPLEGLGRTHRLPSTTPIRPAPKQTWEPPRTAVEKRLSEIWGSTLGIAEVGLYDNFFELGGHSLLATQVISRVREAFAIDLSMRRLFEAPTLAALAAVIEEQIEVQLRG